MSIDIRASAFHEQLADEKWERTWTLPQDQWPDLTSEGEMTNILDLLGQRHISRETMIQKLVDVDLAFGSDPVDIEEGKMADDFLRFLFSTFVPEIPTERMDDPLGLGTADFIRLFERLSVQRIEEAIKALTPEAIQKNYWWLEGSDRKEFVDMMVGFAWQIRPLVKECKVAGARLVWNVSGQTSDDLLKARAENHLAKLVELLLGLNEKFGKGVIVPGTTGTG